MNAKLDHALHNEDTCNYLDKSGVFNDWVVTTSFYSAKYFVEYKIFPLKYHKKKYDDFTTFYTKEDIMSQAINSSQQLFNIIQLLHIYILLAKTGNARPRHHKDARQQLKQIQAFLLQ